MWLSHLLVVQIKAVFELPPRLSLRSLVRVDSLNGTLVPSPRAWMTRPRIVRLKLIFLASSRTFPVAPVLAIRSEPARSTRLSLAFFFEPSLLI